MAKSVLLDGKAPDPSVFTNPDGSLKTDGRGVVDDIDYSEVATDGVDGEDGGTGGEETEVEEVAEETPAEAEEVEEAVDEPGGLEPENLAGKSREELIAILTETKRWGTQKAQEAARARAEAEARAVEVEVPEVIVPVVAPVQQTAEQQTAAKAARGARIAELFYEECRELQAIDPNVDFYREDPNVLTTAEQVAYQRAQRRLGDEERMAPIIQQAARQQVASSVAPVVAQFLAETHVPGVSGKELVEEILGNVANPQAFQASWEQCSAQDRSTFLRREAYVLKGMKEERAAAVAAKTPAAKKPPAQPVPRVAGGSPAPVKPGGRSVTLTAQESGKVAKVMKDFGFSRDEAIGVVKGGK